MTALGHTRWVIAEGYIPPGSTGAYPEFVSHEAACILNTGDVDAHVTLTIYYDDCEPKGPYRIHVPARRTLHQRFNDLYDPEPIPIGRSYSSVFESTVPVVIQHTRLDSRQAANSIMTTMAFPVPAQ